MNGLYTVKEFAALQNMSTQAVYKMISKPENQQFVVIDGATGRKMISAKILDLQPVTGASLATTNQLVATIENALTSIATEITDIRSCNQELAIKIDLLATSWQPVIDHATKLQTTVEQLATSNTELQERTSSLCDQNQKLLEQNDRLEQQNQQLQESIRLLELEVLKISNKQKQEPAAEPAEAKKKKGLLGLLFRK